MDPFGVEKGTSIRMPSTANFLISSYDRNNNLDTAGRFQIVGTQSLLNGFFTRLAVTELAMNWNVPNLGVNTDISSNLIRIDISGVGIQSYVLPVGQYTCADALDTFIALFNASSGGGRTLAATSTGQIVTLTMTGGTFRFPAANNTLIQWLQFGVGGNYAASIQGFTSPVNGVGPSESLQPIIYLDFTSSQLTYNQLLKDASTDKFDRDDLIRFYMNYDNDMNQVDKYGYAIRMGMKPFYIRRTFNPPKQIRWSGSQPVGNVQFEVFATYEDENGYYKASVPLLNENYNWLMTIQVSEV